MDERIKDEERAFRERLGDRLRQARRRNAKSLQEVADYFGLSKATVGHWETGTNPPDVGKLFRLARYYGTALAELVAEPLTREQMATMLAKAVLQSQEERPPAPPHRGVKLARSSSIPEPDSPVVGAVEEAVASSRKKEKKRESDPDR